MADDDEGNVSMRDIRERDDWTKVVGSAVAGRDVAIHRDVSGALFLDDGAECTTRLTAHQATELALGDELSLVGGKLPDGAAIAEVFDHAGRRHEAQVGQDVWIAVLQQPCLGRGLGPPVCYRTASGTLVPAPLPSRVVRRPVDDASERCPACGGASWDELVPDQSIRHDPHSEHAGAAVWVCCRSCAHTESAGLIRLIAGPESDAVTRSELPREALSTLTFPVYQAAGQQGRMSVDGGRTGVTVKHAALDRYGSVSSWVTVRTQTGTVRQRNRRSAASWDLITALDHATPLSDAAASVSDCSRRTAAGAVVRSRAVMRDSVRSAMRASRSTITISVDGESEPFLCLQSTHAWAARRISRKPTIIVSGRDAAIPRRLTRIVS